MKQSLYFHEYIYMLFLQCCTGLAYSCVTAMEHFILQDDCTLLFFVQFVVGLLIILLIIPFLKIMRSNMVFIFLKSQKTLSSIWIFLDIQQNIWSVWWLLTTKCIISVFKALVWYIYWFDSKYSYIPLPPPLIFLAKLWSGQGKIYNRGSNKRLFKTEFENSHSPDWHGDENS